MRLAALTFAALAMTACAPAIPGSFAETPNAAARTFAQAFGDQPFDTGPVTVLTEEHGELHSYTLAPCRGGAAICAGSIRGRAGTLSQTADYAVVAGAYAGRTFYLSPGGDGWMLHRGAYTPLAWDDESPPSAIAVSLTTAPDAMAAGGAE